MRTAALLLAAAAAVWAAPERRPEFVQAVEFPYYLYPRQSWERELVWLKAIGIRTVRFTIPWGWHQPQADVADLRGNTSPRRDLAGLIRILRRLEMRAWIRPLPAARGGEAQRAWVKELERLLAPQTVSHGGPVAYVEGGGLGIDASAPPSPVTAVRATDPSALARSRKAMGTGRGALVWQDVEDAIYPAGWTESGGTPFRKGAVGLNGEERVATAAMRRNAALLLGWGLLFPALEAAPVPKPATKPPGEVAVTELISAAASAVSIVNGSDQPYRDDLRVLEPASRRTMVIPGVTVGPGEALWLPLHISIGRSPLCRNCSALSSSEAIVYATAELHSMEYENGILSMEFSTPRPAEAILQMARQPVGPYLAAGRPSEFDWDEKTLRARLPIPAGQGQGHRVRVGLAIEAPESSAFFVDVRRLVIGRMNVVATSYSSPELAARSRLRLPEGWTARKKEKSPVEIDYEVDVPAAELHGDWATLALEADGVTMGRARLQLFRPVSVRCNDGVRLRYGAAAELAVEPAIVPADARSGRNLEIVIRNNSPGIETYRVEAAGAGLSFSPVRTEVTVGATMERTVSLRVFPDASGPALREAKVRISGAATFELPVRVLLVPRGRTAAWTADLDGDGSPEWILESHRARAVFSSADGGRWMEFTWKDAGTDVLPETGVWAAAGPVEVKESGGGLEFSTARWKRTVRLEDNVLQVEQTTGLPADSPVEGKHGTVVLRVGRLGTKGTFALN
jgi:hypothetical protein